ncbi:MAG: replication initiator [Solirubrobacteraceae bacterium]
MADVVSHAIRTTTVTLPRQVLADLPTGTPGRLRWGRQHEVTAMDSNRGAAAGYIAKYATKATETVAGGTLIKPVRTRAAITRLEAIGQHPQALVAASWTLGERLDDHAYRRWAHQFGYGGHTLTKSRGYSTTFTKLRAARADWHEPPGVHVIVQRQLTYAGRGHTNTRGLS